MSKLSKITLLALWCISLSISIFQFAIIANAGGMPSSSRDFLSEEEINWINQNKTVTAAVRTGWMPIEYKIASEPTRGISVDYLTQISELTGIKFKIVEYNQIVDSPEVQLITGVIGNKKLNNFTNTHPPHLLIPYAIYVNKNTQSEYKSVTLDDLSSAKVALYKNTPFGNALKKMYPNMKLRYVDIVDEAFEDLKSNHIDAYIGNELVVDYHAEFH